MKIQLILLATLFCLFHNVKGYSLEENYGYVDVRTGAHMFWVLYHTELPGDWTEYPLIIWLQGGPGASGVGFGNFKELGPYDVNGNLRPGRWTQKASILFVDNPVGTGYSYVDQLNLLCTNNSQIAADLLTLTKSVFADYPDLQKMPLFIYSESYGGKMASDFAIALNKAIGEGELVSNFQGVALGDSWISPMDFVNTWGSFLYWMGLVNEKGQAKIDAAAAQTQEAVDSNRWSDATDQWSQAETVVLEQTRGVDFYNVLVRNSSVYSIDAATTTASTYSFMRPQIRDLFTRHVQPMSQDSLSLSDFMNGPQKQKWNIPEEVTWGGQSGHVFDYLSDDFMRPVIESVANLLENSDIHVSVFTGDLDLICDTPGTYLWISKMDYPQKTHFESSGRKRLKISAYTSNAAYVQRYERFSLFTILRSGHMVAIDAPEMALQMVDLITQYGAEAASQKTSQTPRRGARVVHGINYRNRRE